MVGVAVANDLQRAMLERVKSINATVFNWHLLKENAAGLTVSDMRGFIHWLITAPLSVVSRPEELQNKFKELSQYKLPTYFTVNAAQDAQSMLPLLRRNAVIFICTGPAGDQRMAKKTKYRRWIGQKVDSRSSDSSDEAAERW